MPQPSAHKPTGAFVGAWLTAREAARNGAPAASAHGAHLRRGSPAGWCRRPGRRHTSTLSMAWRATNGAGWSSGSAGHSRRLGPRWLRRSLAWPASPAPRSLDVPGAHG